MKLKNIPEIGSEHFSYHADTRSFSTFASDLSLTTFTGVSRIYDDACDAGFYLVSEKTGKKILFVEVAEHTNDDNEITHWEYSAYCLNENPKELLDLKLMIWND